MTGEARRAIVPTFGVVILAWVVSRLLETVPVAVMSAVLTVSVLLLAAAVLAVKVAVTWTGGAP